MRQEKIVSFKNLAVLNKFLSTGWEFCHTLGGKQEFALIRKYRNGENTNRGELSVPPAYRG